MHAYVDISLANTKTFIEECIVTSKLDHPNVLSLLGVSINAENVSLLMIMPFMHHGDVKSFLKSKRGDMIEFDHFPKVYIIINTCVTTYSSYLCTYRCYYICSTIMYTCIINYMKQPILFISSNVFHMYSYIVIIYICTYVDLQQWQSKLTYIYK